MVLHDATDEAALRDVLRIITKLGASAAAGIAGRKMRQLGIRRFPPDRGPRRVRIRSG